MYSLRRLDIAGVIENEISFSAASAAKAKSMATDSLIQLCRYAKTPGSVVLEGPRGVLCTAKFSPDALNIYGKFHEGYGWVKP